MGSNRQPLVLLAALVACFGLFEVLDYGRKMIGIDYYDHWVGGRVAGDARWGHIYGPAAGETIGAEFLSRAQSNPAEARQLAVARSRSSVKLFQTPWLYTVVRWTSRNSYESSFRAFRVGSLIAFALAIGGLAQLLGYRPAASLLTVGLAAYSFQPLMSDVRVGNVNQVQLAALSLFLAVQRLARDNPRWQFASGALLASALAFKPNLIWVPVLLFASWAVSGRMRELGRQVLGMTGGGMAIFALTAWSFGSSGIWLEWANRMRDHPAEWVPLGVGNFAPARWILERSGADATLPLLLGALLLSFAAIWIGRTIRDDSSGNAPWSLDVAWSGLGCLFFLTQSYLVWQHYLLLTLPLLLYLLRPQEAANRIERRWLRIRWLGAAGCWLLLAIDPLTDLLRIRELGQQALLVFVALAALWALLLGDLWFAARSGRARGRNLNAT